MFILAIYIFHFWLLNAFFKCFFIPNSNLSFIYKTIVWACFFIAQLFIASQITHPLILFLFNCLITAILCFVLYKANLKKTLFLSIASCAVGMLIEIIVSILLQKLEYTQSNISILGAVISKLILLFFVHAVSIVKNHQSQNSPSLFSWLLLIVMTVSSIIIIHTLYYFNQESSNSLSDNLYFISIILLLIINIGFFIFNDKLSKSTDIKIENLVLSQQIKHYEELRASKEEQISFFNREKHNLKNQLLSIRAYALKEENSAIIDFTNKLLTESDFGLTPISVCDNLILDAILSSKINIAKKNGVEYTWNINVPSKLPFGDIDLCILLGNAIENAFDACLADKRNTRFVHITIHYKQNCLYLHFENTYAHKLIKSNNIFLSTKANPSSHGYGLSSIEDIVKKYNGIIQINTKNTVFSLKLILYENKSTLQ